VYYANTIRVNFHHATSRGRCVREPFLSLLFVADTPDEAEAEARKFDHDNVIGAMFVRAER
jgi:hypothetical protein